VRLGKEPKESRLWWINAVLTFTVSYGLVYWAEQWVPSGLAAVIFATFPLFVALLAHFFLPGERLRPGTFLGVLIGFIGVAVLYSEDLGALVGPRAGFAAKVMLIAPVASAIANVAVKRWGSGVPPLSVSGVSMGLGALLVVPLAWGVERGRDVTFSARPVLAVAYLAVVGSAVALTVYYWLLRKLPAPSHSLINYATPVVAVLIGTLWLGEPFTLRILLGAGLVVVGVAISMR
jgi:drug/metabolite transporter (DMT)-like permease